MISASGVHRRSNRSDGHRIRVAPRRNLYEKDTSSDHRCSRNDGRTDGGVVFDGRAFHRWTDRWNEYQRRGNIDELVEKYELTEFSVEELYINGLVSRTDKVKVLGNGELKSKIPFRINAISGSAKAAIEGLGSSVELV